MLTKDPPPNPRASAGQAEVPPRSTSEPVTLASRPNVRVPLRPLAAILRARAEGGDPQQIEAKNRQARLEALAEAGWRAGEWRLILLAAAFFCGFALIGARMALLAATPPIDAGVAQVEEIVEGRAEIVDRQGRLLATNLLTHALYVETRYLVDPERAARALARIFPDIDPTRLTERLTNPAVRFAWIRSRLSPEQAQAVHDIGEPGLMLGPRRMRLYPNGPLAAHVLGGATFGEQGVNAAEIVGVAGIERALDNRLRDPDLIDIPLRLSLDLTVQAVVEEILQGGMTTLSARAAAAVVMDAHTGEILALASLPAFDPNNRPAPPSSGRPSESPLFNHAVQGVYELGSVMKGFAIAQALDLGLVRPETLVDTRGPLRVGRFTISDFRNYGPQLSVTDVFVKSSNIGTARLVQMIGRERQRAFLERLGLLEPLPLELAEAARARPLVPDRWSDVAAMTIGYGHGLSISLVHLAAGYAALVNGGFRVRPTLLAQTDAAPEPNERVISETTSAAIRRMMRETVLRGTATLAEVPGYGVGGKTGTADKPDERGGYHRDRVIATFVAAFPIHDPRYVVAVMLDEAQETSGSEVRRTAGWTAAPVTGEIVRRIAPLLGLRPQDESTIAAALGLR